MRIVPLTSHRRLFLAVALAFAAVAAVQIWVGVTSNLDRSEPLPHSSLASFKFSVDPVAGTVEVTDLYARDSGTEGVVRAVDVNAQFAIASLNQAFASPTFTLDVTFQKTSGATNPNVYSRTTALNYTDNVAPHPTLLSDRCGNGVGSEIEATPPGGGFVVDSFFDISYSITLPRQSLFDFRVDLHEGPSGCLNSPPTAAADFYDALGNTELVVGLPLPATPATEIAGSLLDGDTDPDFDTLAVVPFIGLTANAGLVDIDADGHFTYRPAQGFTGSDSFPYTVEDGNGGSDTGIATITVIDMIWYVDRDVAPGGDGRSHDPFSSLVPLSTGGSADAADGPGDIIFVHEGAGPTTGGIVLENDQELIGQGVDLSIAGFSPDPLVASSGPPTVAATSGNGITLASGNTVQGLNVASIGGGGIVGSSTGVLTISDIPSIDTSSGVALKVGGGIGALVSIDSITVNNFVGGGIELTNNVGSAFTFSDLDITTTGGIGLQVSNSGTLEISGGTASIDTTNAVGLSITNTTIGAAGITFQSISASGGAYGIVLDTTGSLGGLTVTGVGTTAGSGGTLSSPTADGIELISTHDVSLKNMNISSTGRHGINGTGVTNLTINRLVLSNIGNADGEHGITLEGFGGTGTIDTTTITNAADHNVRLVNSSGTVDSFVVTNSVFTGGAASTHGGSGVFVRLTGTAVITNLQIGDTTSPADGANNTQFISMDGFGVSLNAGQAPAVGGEFTAVSIDDIAVTAANAGGVLLATDGTGSGVFSLTNSHIEGDNSAAVAVGADGNSTAVATISNNMTTVINTSFFGVSNIGIRADGNLVTDTPELRVTLNNNSIQGGDAFGINASSRGSQGSLDLKVTDNTVANVGDDAMRIRAGNGTPGESDTVRVFLSGNTATIGIGSQGYDLRDQSASTTFEIGCDLGAFPGACTLLIGITAANDQGVLALQSNLGTTNFIGSFTIIDSTGVNAP